MMQALSSLLRVFFYTACLYGTLSETFAGPLDRLSPSAVTDTSSQAIESPRMTMRSFLEAIKRDDVVSAAAFIDFPRRMNSQRRQDLTLQLMTLLNKKAQIDLAQISDVAAGRLTDGFVPDSEVVGRIVVQGEVVPIELRRVQLPGEERKVWHFAPEFIEKVPDLLDRIDQYNIEDHLHPLLISTNAFGVKAWQWVGLGLSLILGGITSSLLAYVLIRLINFCGHRLRLNFKEGMLKRLISPLRWLTGLLVFRIGRSFLELTIDWRQTLLYIENVALTIFISFLTMRIVEVMIELSRINFERQGRGTAAGMLQPIQKGIKAVVVVLAMLWIMRALGFDVTAVMAGLGVGGLAVALAGQKTIENLFGGISVILDQPVRVGDSGKFGDVSGTVEEIGLRSTKIRTFDRTIITIPNAEFSLMKLENYERRDKMRWSSNLGMRYETTPQQMRFLLMRLKELLIGHPMVLNEPARVRFVRYGASALEIEIFCYLNTADVQVYWSIVEDLNLKIMDIVSECGTDFAFPSMTVYTGQSFDREKQNAVLAKAQQVAKSSGFPQPLYPPEWVEPRVDRLRFGPELPTHT